MELTNTLKKSLLELAPSDGFKGAARANKQQIIELYQTKARKQELLDLARLLGHKVTARNTKQQLLELCMPATKTGLPAASSINIKNENLLVRDGFEATPKTQMPKEPEIYLPWHYDENRLVLMPVNPYKVYGYWEVTGEVEADGKKYQTADYQLVLNLMAAGEDTGAHVVQTVEIGPFGEFYFDHYLARRTVWLELGLKDRRGVGTIPGMSFHKTPMPRAHISVASR